MAIGDKIYIADKPTLDEVKSNIGATTDTGGTTTTGGIFAKLNAILQQFLSNWTASRAAKIDTISSGVINLSNRGGVKSIQRGTVVFPTEDNISITISTINPQKTFVILDNSFIGVGSFTGAYVYGTSLVELTSTTLVLTANYMRSGGGASAYDKPVSYQVVEFY